MADFTTVGTVELLTRAADAAGKAAATISRLEVQSRVTWVDGIDRLVGMSGPRKSLALASGPDHWRAVEALLRGMLAEHDRYWRQHQEPEHHCRHGYIACHLVHAARPLAEQVLQHLGDTE